MVTGPMRIIGLPGPVVVVVVVGWSFVSALQIDEVYKLLFENYVEDDDNMFRFDYSREFLEWALKPPGYRADWHAGVRRQNKARTLMGFITGVPAHVRVYQK
jgi:glycylpeptide N-tetradecanoyltransferase